MNLNILTQFSKLKKNKVLINSLILFLFTLLIYSLSHKGEGAHWNYFVLLSDAFLNGKLNVLENPPWLNELVNWNGKFYVVYPPMPAILLTPLVAIFGPNFYQPYFSIFLGAVNVFLAYLVLIRLFNKQVAWWISLLYAFGTMQWFHAQVGSAWYLAHIVALFFLWLMLLEALTKRRLFLMGLLIGAAFLARLPTILAFLFIIIFFHERFFDFNKERFKLHIKNLILFFSGLAMVVIINGLYNYFRFGTFENIAYQLLPIFDEPWYKYGLFHIKYIPIHLSEIFTALPLIKNEPPFIIPSLNVMAIWFVTPAFLLAFFANYKKKIALACLIAIVVVALPGLMHGSNGFTQFGFRFSLDYHPFLLILVGLAVGEKVRWWVKLLILLSIVINTWGVIMINYLNIWAI